MRQFFSEFQSIEKASNAEEDKHWRKFESTQNAEWNFNRNFFLGIELGIVFKIQSGLYATGVGVILF